MCLGIPAQVVEMTSEDFQLATVDVGGARRTVNVGPVTADGQGLRPGDWVLVQAGFALSRLDAAEAAATLAYLRELGRAHADELVVLRDDHQGQAAAEPPSGTGA